MNSGQSHPSPTIRAFTNENFLATYRIGTIVFQGVTAIMLAVISFFAVRMVNNYDDVAKQMQRLEIMVTASIATNTAAESAMQDRVSAQSRRMDGFDIEFREVNKKLYEGRK